MNILPKKSWHVRNKDNIERVRRDEENARKEEEERQRRAALADSEARTELLRSKAELRQRNSDAIHEESKELVSTAQPSKHINFFSELEEGGKTNKGNEDYEREKKEEREKHEKAIGLLTYLGQSSVESQGANKPWYLTTDKKQLESEQKQPSDLEYDTKGKLAQDPMRQMCKYISTKHKVEGTHYRPFLPQKPTQRDSVKRGEEPPGRGQEIVKKKRKRSPSSSSSDSGSYSSSEEERKRRKKHKKKHKKKSKKRKKEKKHKKHKKSSSKDKSDILLSVTPSATKTIQQLRAERLKREQEERLRSQKLLQKLNSSKEGGKEKGAESEGEKVELDERKRGYNSQFNPELARTRRREKIDISDFD